MSKKVLITGASGMVGHYLVQKCMLANGHALASPRDIFPGGKRVHMQPYGIA